MSMFCYQCQETVKNTGCTKRGVCGKDESTANLQDLLIHTLKGVALHAQAAREAGREVPTSIGRFVAEGLFTTITNCHDPPLLAAKVSKRHRASGAVTARCYVG